MCVILVCPRGVRPDEAVLRACERINPHGAGVAWREAGAVRWTKGLTAAGVAEALSSVHGEAVVHFRYASVGGVEAALCHPFPVSASARPSMGGKSEAVIFHNGTWGGWEGALTCVGAFKASAPRGPMSDSRLAAILVHHCGHRVLRRLPGRWALFGSRRTLLYGQWEKWGGMSVSNTAFVRAVGGREEDLPLWARSWARGGDNAENQD